MKRRSVNPWTWQEQYGFEQAVEVTGGERVLYCAGQTSTDADGKPIPGDMAAQLAKALDNLEEVLALAGMTLANLVRLNYYVTSTDEFFAAGMSLGARLSVAGCHASGTLLEVSRLAFPEYRVEIEATAVA